MNNEHLKWIDIAKGIGIIAVVMGHGGHELAHHYTYWFHMPLFFILSGLLFKPIDNFSDLFNFIKKRAIRLLLPYVSFGITIYFYIELKNGFELSSFLTDLYKLAYGGMMMKGLVTVFWFITCLFLVQIIFAVIDLIFKNNITKIALITLSYLLAHIYAFYQPFESPVPWSADVVLITLSFYAFGFYIKKYIGLILNVKTFIASFLLLTVFIVYDYMNNYFYQIDLKPNVYNHLFLDFFIPVIICFVVFNVSKILSKYQYSSTLIKIGTSTITIMFLHRVSNDFFSHFFNYGIVVYTIIGVLVPFICYLILLRVPYISIAFLGLSSNTVKQKNNKATVA
ncbi:acyltransferase family protein [Paraliobacillus ryukyuensis]|uniref:acyltransferase family protein n=1 Tax=Paraliobacillus ryukyuensis TaxID=200904 RepID=UPI0009A65F1F|nr:acyltransferase family protein [Paraliobacillus ryukyuensis]